MKKIATIILFFFITNSIIAQTGWELNISTDDYTMEKIYRVMYNDEKGVPAASFNPDEESLNIMKFYSGKTFFDESFNAMMDNGGHIAPWSTVIEYRFVKGEDYKEYEEAGVEIVYYGFDEDHRINTKLKSGG